MMRDVIKKIVDYINRKFICVHEHGNDYKIDLYYHTDIRGNTFRGSNGRIYTCSKCGEKYLERIKGIHY